MEVTFFCALCWTALTAQTLNTTQLENKAQLFPTVYGSVQHIGAIAINAGFQRKGHTALLRTFNKYGRMPQLMNRTLVSQTC